MISRVIGLGLSADALLTLLLTVGSGGWTSYQQEIGRTMIAAQIETASALRALPTLSPPAIDEFLQRGTISAEWLWRSATADRRAAEALLNRYESRAARAALISSIVSSTPVRWTCALLILAGWFVVRRHRASSRNHYRASLNT